jgi:pyruvate/2-oxoglutarate dehydrogenase complex dihydrolipoamide dehydrogenase (E3) component
VWAIGDVTGQGVFIHGSMYQARIAAFAASDAFGADGEIAGYRAVPRVNVHQSRGRLGRPDRGSRP